MQLNLVRRTFSDRSTIGDLSVVGETFRCFSLEDFARAAGAPKVPGRTAIPCGTYEVRLSWSPRFKRILPELLRVPDFTGVRMHSGNDDLDTEACILVGFVEKRDRIERSHDALNRLIAIIKRFSRGGKVFITITENRSSVK